MYLNPYYLLSFETMFHSFYLHFIKYLENEKIICQFVGIIKGCDQTGDRVSKNDKSGHICSMKLQGFCLAYHWENMGLCL